ncbi:MAG: hypothetical protein U5K43_08345 [Halofilum sp. (in: g-proteobacteria)]|nr:hypothetical protein [Halofilum sp. (in: g-proteobacteria)]
MIGTPSGDTLDGDAGRNVLQGGAGDDVLAGRGGDDVLIGGAGRWDVAVFSGTRDEYDITAMGDYLEVAHRNGGADGTDHLYGMQELRFTDHSVHIDHARADQGEVRVTSATIQFTPTRDFNSLDGAAAAFAYEAGRADGARAVESVSIDVAAVNDAPYTAPGQVDYDGQIDTYTYDPDPSTKGGATSYPSVNATGRILGMDVESGTDLTYALLENTAEGEVELEADGSFRYRINTGPDAPSGAVGRSAP